MKIISILTILLTVLIFTPSLVQAQDDELGDLGFEDAPMEEQRPPYFGIGAGYTASFFFPDFSELNSSMTDNFDLDDLKGSVYMNGVEMFFVAVLVKNLRASVSVNWGSKQTESSFEEDGQSFTRALDYQVNNFFVFSLDYAFVLTKNFALIPRVSFGTSSLTIDTYQGTTYNWGNVGPNTDELDWMKRAEAGYYLISPQLNLEWAITDFVMFRVGGGYNLSMISDWEYNRGARLEGVPDDINANGPFVQFGLFAGLFNY